MYTYYKYIRSTGLMFALRFVHPSWCQASLLSFRDKTELGKFRGGMAVDTLRVLDNFFAKKSLFLGKSLFAVQKKFFT